MIPKPRGIGKSGWVSQAALNEALESEAPIVITIHGTGDGDEFDHGPRWWQIGSDFHTRLRQKAGLEILNFIPFHWSGDNSDYERFEASRRLANVINIICGLNRDIAVVTHSHGGNVILSAIRYFGSLNSRLRVVSCVGTPFIERRRGWLSILSFAFSIIAFPAAALFSYSAIGQDMGSARMLNYPSRLPYWLDVLLRPIDAIEFLLTCSLLLIFLRFGILYIYRLWVFLLTKSKLTVHATFSTHDEVLSILPYLDNYKKIQLVGDKSAMRIITRMYASIGLFVGIIVCCWWLLAFYPLLEVGAYRFTLVVPSGIMIGFLGYVSLFVIGKIFDKLSAQLYQFFANKFVFGTLRRSILGADHDYKLVAVAREPANVPCIRHEISKRDLGGLSLEDINDAALSIYDELLKDGPISSAVNFADVWKNVNAALYHNAYFRDEELVELVANQLALGGNA